MVEKKKGGEKKMEGQQKKNNNKKKKRRYCISKEASETREHPLLNPNPEEKKKGKASLPEHHLCNRRFSEE